MLVDNPELLFQIICSAGDEPLSLPRFKRAMESVLGHKIHLKTAHTYFYTATTFELLTPVTERFGRGAYIVSDIAIELCSLKVTDLEQFRRKLKSLLLSNTRKGELFRRFMEFVREPASDSEIYREFEEPTGKTLIALSQQVGLIRKDGNLVVGVTEQSKAQVTEEQFWDELHHTYSRLRNTGLFHAKRYFIPISELRARVSIKLDLEKPREFDAFLGRILESERGRTVSLYGAPPHIMEKPEETFNYRGRDYVYLSIGI